MLNKMELEKKSVHQKTAFGEFFRVLADFLSQLTGLSLLSIWLTELMTCKLVTFEY